MTNSIYDILWVIWVNVWMCFFYPLTSESSLVRSISAIIIFTSYFATKPLFFIFVYHIPINFFVSSIVKSGMLYPPKYLFALTSLAYHWWSTAALPLLIFLFQSFSDLI